MCLSPNRSESTLSNFWNVSERYQSCKGFSLNPYFISGRSHTISSTQTWKCLNFNRFQNPNLFVEIRQQLKILICFHSRNRWNIGGVRKEILLYRDKFSKFELKDYQCEYTKWSNRLCTLIVDRLDPRIFVSELQNSKLLRRHSCRRFKWGQQMSVLFLKA